LTAMSLANAFDEVKHDVLKHLNKTLYIGVTQALSVSPK